MLQFPAGIYMLKVNNRDARTRCEIFSKLTITIPGPRHPDSLFNKVAGLRRSTLLKRDSGWCRSGVFIVNVVSSKSRSVVKKNRIMKLYFVNNMIR